MSTETPQIRLRALPGSARSSHPPRGDDQLIPLVRDARNGSSAAWAELVRRFEGHLRRVARSYRLPPADVDDVVQATWLALLLGIERLRGPAAIPGWLTITTRRNALRALQSGTREQLTEQPDLGDRPDLEGPEEHMLAAERRSVLAEAVAALPDRHRQVITVLAASPSPKYDRIGEALSMPVG